ncbi:sporulation integral membrane protein YtvI [Oceanivirga salmonicida]|uniref:sporulation integral membrane protein YtvI n=1 Tax=Oceanivirga salmonicida TaxID=1769291 RepID=UPI0008310766|nr:sporulation integral membrane protein YtvI [Oceanivirga salmonicida]
MGKFDIKRLSGILYVIAILLLLFITFKLMIFLLPFVIAAMIVSIVKPIINYLERKTHISSKIINPIVLILFYLIIGGLIVLLFSKIIYEGYKFGTFLIESQNMIENQIENIVDIIVEKLDFLPNYMIDFINNFIDTIIDITSKYFIPVIKSGLGILSSLPKLIIFFVITVLSSFFMLKDEKIIEGFLKKQIPKTWLSKFYEIKEGVFKMLMIYLRTQLILTLLCFVELIIGLNLINIFIHHINYVLLFAFIIGVVDALPMIGAAAVIMPWAFMEVFLNGNYVFALSLLALNLTITLIRQTLEPKLMSKGAKINPLLTLIAMYSGFRVFGIIGFLIGPVIMSILKIVFYEEIQYGFFKFLINEKK